MPFIGDQANAGNSKIIKSRFTATASQEDFSVSSNAGDELQVFLNGVLLKETDDYTYTTSTVSLGTGATVSDIVEVHVYQSFAVADAVKESGDTMTGELEVPTVKLSSNVIKASDGGSTITLDDSDNVTVAGKVKVGGNIIQASDGGNTLTLDTSDNLTVAGNVKVGGNIIQASDGGNTLTLDTSDNLTVAGNIQVGGNVIKASDGGSTITLDTSDNVVVAGNLQTDEVRARDGDGLKLYDDGGNGIFVKDGGLVGIGTLTPGGALHVSYNSDIPFQVDGDGTRRFACDDNANDLFMFGTWQTSMSDKDLKNSIVSLTGMLDKILETKPVTYKWNEGVGRLDNEITHYGVLAQEIKEVFPSLVYEDEDGHLNVRRDEIQFILIQAVKELSAKNDALEARITKLEKEKNE